MLRDTGGSCSARPPSRPLPRAHATGHAHAHSDLPKEASARGVGRRGMRNGGDAVGVWDGGAAAVSAKRRATAIALWCSRSGRGSMLCLCAWCVVCVCPPPTHTRARHARARSSECGHCPSWPGRPDAAAETPPWRCAHVLTCHVWRHSRVGVGGVLWVVGFVCASQRVAPHSGCPEGERECTQRGVGAGAGWGAHLSSVRVVSSTPFAIILLTLPRTHSSSNQVLIP